MNLYKISKQTNIKQKNLKEKELKNMKFEKLGSLPQVVLFVCP